MLSNVKVMGTRAAITAAAGYSPIRPELLFPGVRIYKGPPTINKFIVANPKAFLEKSKMSKLYLNIDSEIDSLDLTTPLWQYAAMLPVIYIAETHPEYGTLGKSSLYI